LHLPNRAVIDNIFRPQILKVIMQSPYESIWRGSGHQSISLAGEHLAPARKGTVPLHEHQGASKTGPDDEPRALPSEIATFSPPHFVVSNVVAEPSASP
jgi:hypothetical protein